MAALARPLFLLVLVAVVLVGFLILRSPLWESLLPFFTTPKVVPRPMFHEWAEGDWGPGWRHVPIYRDSVGVEIIIDVPNNIVVVFATRAAGEPWGIDDYRSDRAILRQTTAFETIVLDIPDRLVWRGCDAAEAITIEPGTAARIDCILRNDSTGVRSKVLLDTLLDECDGENGAELQALIRG